MYAGSTPTEGNSRNGLLRALSSFFKKKPDIKPSLDEETHGDDKVRQLIITCWLHVFHFELSKTVSA